VGVKVTYRGVHVQRLAQKENAETLSGVDQKKRRIRQNIEDGQL